MSRYLVGIDLGTTNIAVAYVDTHDKKSSGSPKLHTFPVPQLVAAGQVGEQPLLPSFLYRPGPHDLPPGSTSVPWNPNATDVIGVFARLQGAKVPGRLVSSAKSWLCHAGVDRTAPLLPWAAPPEVVRISAVEASTQYLRHLIDTWNQKLGKTPDTQLEGQAVVITVPASFDDVARTLTAEAATKAGFKNFSLLEEPQAAFYAWLGTRPPKETTALTSGMRCLVVDVGGGTSDFSLIRVGEDAGELSFLRDAVGEHLLLGGDNMDLALAKAVEAKLPGGKVDAAQFGGLIQACRSAKEVLLAEKPPESYAVTVVGRGRSVVGSTVSVPITPADVREALFDGFFPTVDLTTEPIRGGPRAGLQEMGLPYVADPAITKHLAKFVRTHVPTGEPVQGILFNGGVFQPAVLRQRIVDVLRHWSGANWSPIVLSSPSLDLAVAWGAAYFAWLKHNNGRRIGGGIPRSYYLGVTAGTEAKTVCVVPRQLEEGQSITLTEPKLELTIGRPVLFPLYSSTARGSDRPGDVLPDLAGQLRRLPPLHTVLRGGKRAGTKQVPVTLSAKCTEIGTLELVCLTPEGNRWKLEFNVREAIEEPPLPTDDAAQPRVSDVWPDETVSAAAKAIRDTFSPTGSSNPQDLTKRLETALEAGRNDWPSGLCRRLWDDLSEAAEHRTRGPAYLARWYNLTGFCLRPGFGDPLDRYRVEAVWKILSGGATAKPGTVVEGGADYWIMWRRLAGGLNTALQQNLFTKMKPVLLPSRTKPPPKPLANELVEMWRAAAALERLDPGTKEKLGAELLLKLDTPPTYLFWSLTRLGARVPLYGPLNALVHTRTVEDWLDRLLSFEPGPTDRLGWAFCLAQLARLTGVRAVDVDDQHRNRVMDRLRSGAYPAGWSAMVREVTTSVADDQSQLFGDSLPVGLRLNG